jgi:hypothetical protein
VERISEQIRKLLPSWRLTPVVEALQALRGVSWIVATTVVAELGDLRRFQPRELMAFVGLVPSERSSGERRRRGGITKSGNAHVRRVLCEAAWAYAYRPAISLALLKRQEQLPQQIREIAWKGQLRLCNRFAHLALGRKHRNKINTAIGRELLGFMWDIARSVTPSHKTRCGKQGPPTPTSPEILVLRRRPRRARKRAVA